MLIEHNKTPDLRLGDTVHYIGHHKDLWGLPAKIVGMNPSPATDLSNVKLFFGSGTYLNTTMVCLQRPMLLAELSPGDGDIARFWLDDGHVERTN